MAERKISLSEGDITYVKPSELTEGTNIAGTYLGLTSQDQFGKCNHKIRNEDGTISIVNSAGKLDALMSKVSAGSAVRIVYLGKQRIEKGANAGKSAHNFDVFVSDDATEAAGGIF